MEKKLRKRGYSCLFLSLFALQMMAQGNKISLQCSQASLPSTLYQVEKMSGYYRVSYNYDLLKDYQVSADFKDLPAPKAIEMLLASTPFTIKVEGSRINVVRKSTQKGDEKPKVNGQILDSDGNPLMAFLLRLRGLKPVQ